MEVSIQMDNIPKKNNKSFLTVLIVSVIFTILAIGLFLWFFANGETTTTGNFPKPETSKSLTCESNTIQSSILNTNNTTRTTSKVTAAFTGNKLDSISITYSLYYSSQDQIEASETTNHANFNLRTQNEGLGPNIFNLHFVKTTDHLEINMYANSKDITEKTSSYLLLDNATALDRSTIEQNYTNKDFKCIVKN